MPVSIQRLNQRGKPHPNDRIVFVKALPGAGHDTALDFLNRVAAICKPIMAANHLSVMTLEEHEPNREFVGRNFNAGEVVQLVLRDRRSGRWLPFTYVQMVMMHELAHCIQMNHSKAFWAVRNAYAAELRGLWARKYTGDGLWGRGQALYSGQFDDGEIAQPEDIAEHLCGGAYRGRGRGRKRRRGAGQKQALTYAERKQRRIEKKFGVNGQELGGDEELRLAFERGKPGAKPRVAQSKRGRELRAQAALLRFAQQKNAEQDEKSNDGSDDDDDTDGDSEVDEVPADAQFARDRDGNKMHDERGRDLVRAVDGEDWEDLRNDPDAQQEMAELTSFSAPAEQTSKSGRARGRRDSLSSGKPTAATTKADDAANEALDTAPAEFSRPSKSAEPQFSNNTAPRSDPPSSATDTAPQPTTDAKQQCPICSLDNEPTAFTCLACAHVLDKTRLTRHWACTSTACHSSGYTNSADVSRCGLCDTPRPP